MNPAAKSIKYFGLYVIATGIALIVAPALLLAPLGLAAPTEIWIRVLGVLAVVVGYYYLSCAKGNDLVFFRASVRGRLLFAALTVLLVVVFSAPAQIILFGLVDVAGAAWTARALGHMADRAQAA